MGHNFFMSESDVVRLVLTTGSRTWCGGFGGDDAPRAVMDSMNMPIKKRGVITGWGEKANYVGSEAAWKVGQHPDLEFPIQRGVIQDLDGVERLLHMMLYNELRVDPKDHSLLLNDPPLSSWVDKERMTQLLFETFEIPSLLLASEAFLSLMAAGRGSGIVLYSGHGVTYAAPIYECHLLPSATQRIPLGGEDVQKFLANLLTREGLYLHHPNSMEIVRTLKENHAYVAQDFQHQVEESRTSTTGEVVYALPDGQTVTVNDCLFRCTETLFSPTLLHRQGPSLQQLVYDSVTQCDPNFRKILFSNVIITGGNTMFRGFADRLKSELQAMVPSTVLPHVVADPARKYAPWVGGSIASELAASWNRYVTKEEYEEWGPALVSRRSIL